LTEINRSMMSPRAISRRLHLLVDGVDLFAQHLERGRRGGRFGHGWCRSKQADWPGASIGQAARESKENVMSFVGRAPGPYR